MRQLQLTATKPDYFFCNYNCAANCVAVI